MGGDEAPCVSAEMLRAEEETSGHPCPRREWPDAEGPALFQLLQLGAYPATAHLFELYWRIRFGSAPLDYQDRMFMRILHARGDEQIAAALWPEPDPPERKD